MESHEILALLPYAEPFLFVDQLHRVDNNGAEGNYTFGAQSYFYQGHFKDNPVTPGVILTECCAQIGLVCLGVYLMGAEMDGRDLNSIQIGMSSSEMEFYKPVLPGETVTVRSEKEYFRFNKLKCKVKMFNRSGELVCAGFLAGMFKTIANGN